MNSFLSTPKIQLSLTLLLIASSAFFHSPSIQTLNLFALSISSAIIFDLFFVRLRRINFIFPSAAIVSGLIIGLLIDPTSLWYEIILASFLAIFIKDFLRINNRHIFNPAASGLFLTGLIFQRPVSWWGVSFQYFSPNLTQIVFFLILLSPALVSIVNVRRWKIILSFLTLYSLIIGPKSFLDPTVLFFALVLAPEPITTPNRAKNQILFGIFIALFALLFSQPFFVFLPDPLITSLLLGNLVFFNRK